MTPQDELTPAVRFSTIMLWALAVLGGALLAAFVLPAWLPGLSSSLLSAEPKAYWYLARASALVAYVLLWLSMVFGLLITNKMARLWPGGPIAFDLHQHTSLLGLAFALFHALILLGDHYIGYAFVQLFMPFASVDFKPFAVGLGQVGFYLLALVSLSFYARAHIGHAPWRLLHYASFFTFVLALGHGLLSGTDTALPAVQMLYWVSGGSVLFLTLYRVFTAPTVLKQLGSAGTKS